MAQRGSKSVEVAVGVMFSEQVHFSRHGLPCASQVHRLRKGPNRLRYAAPCYPVGIVRIHHAEIIRRHGIDFPAVTCGGDLFTDALGAFGRPSVHEGVTVLRHESIEPDPGAEFIDLSVQHRRDDLTAIGMAAEDEVFQLFRLDHGEQVVDVTLQIRLRRRQMRSVAKTGQGRRLNVVARIPEQFRNAHPAPVPCAVY